MIRSRAIADHPPHLMSPATNDTIMLWWPGWAKSKEAGRVV